jgi:hypothetical protein
MRSNMTVKYQLRTVSDINRKYAILVELLDDETVLLSVGMSDQDELDIDFGAEITKRTFGPELLGWFARAMSVTLSENTAVANT